MSAPKLHDKLKKFKITYFVGDYFSSAGEKQKTTILLARSESEAEEDFNRTFHGCHLGWIDEL